GPDLRPRSPGPGARPAGPGPPQPARRARRARRAGAGRLRAGARGGRACLLPRDAAPPAAEGASAWGRDLRRLRPPPDRGRAGAPAARGRPSGHARRRRHLQARRRAGPGRCRARSRVMLPDGVERDYSLARLTTVRTGGTADLFARPDDERKLAELLGWAASE